MGSISIETKKATELTAVTTVADSNLVIVHDGSGLKKITFANFKSATTADVESSVAPLLYNNAGAHNAIYRGKYLGSSVTSAQYAAISAGTFDDLYIGDYWTISSVNWRIAAFDYYYNTGDTACTTHHVVIVPDAQLYVAQMNSSNTTAGAYVGSEMYTTNLATAKTTINAAFSGHVMSHRQYLQNAVTSGYPSAGAWYDSTVELMTEQNVYGGKVFGTACDGSTVPNLYTVDKSQYPLFQHNPYMISGSRNWYWLRDVVSGTFFAFVDLSGDANFYDASLSGGVRPAFCIS